jgi:hypothetical protein
MQLPADFEELREIDTN